MFHNTNKAPSVLYFHGGTISSASIKEAQSASFMHQRMLLRSILSQEKQKFLLSKRYCSAISLCNEGCTAAFIPRGNLTRGVKFPGAKMGA